MWKTGKLKSKKRICSELLLDSPRNLWSPEEEKEGYGEKDLQKRKVLSLEWKSEGVMEY